MILAQGGRFGGWTLYLKDGKPVYCYNFLGLEESKVAASEALAPGKASIRMNFDYDGGGVGKGGTATLLVNGQKVATGRIERTHPMIFSADETAAVGVDDATPVTPDYKERDNAFTGKDPQSHRRREAHRSRPQGGGGHGPTHGSTEESLVRLSGCEPRGHLAGAARVVASARLLAGAARPNPPDDPGGPGHRFTKAGQGEA